MSVEAWVFAGMYCLVFLLLGYETRQNDRLEMHLQVLRRENKVLHESNDQLYAMLASRR